MRRPQLHVKLKRRLRRRTIYEVSQKEIARTILLSNTSTQFSSGLPIQIVITLSKSQFVPHIASITQKTYISGFKSFVVGSRASGSVRSLRWYTAHITVIVVIRTLRVSGTKRIFSSWWAFMLRFQTKKNQQIKSSSKTIKLAWILTWQERTIRQGNNFHLNTVDLE